MLWNKSKISIIKLIAIFFLFISALNYENALRNRTIIYIFLFILYLSINIYRLFSKSNRFLFASFIIELFIIYLYEYNSRYQVNYIFHIHYLITLIELPIHLGRKDSLLLSSLTIIISNIKFAALIYIKPSFGNVSQFVFFLFTAVFIALLMNFLKYYREEEERKRNLNKELMDANIRLNEMSIIEERNRIARDLHDTIGHGLTGTIMGLEMIQVLLDEDINQAKHMIIQLKDSSRENLVRVREVVSTLAPNENISKGVESIKELVDSFKKNSSINIELNIEGIPVITSPSTNIVLYRIIQEGMTNATRHGKADKINIKLIYNADNIKLHIKDNGIGSDVLKKGFGLNSMEDRVFTLGGDISFMSKNGFSIVVNIPLEVQYD